MRAPFFLVFSFKKGTGYKSEGATMKIRLKLLGEVLPSQLGIVHPPHCVPLSHQSRLRLQAALNYELTKLHMVHRSGLHCKQVLLSEICQASVFVSSVGSSWNVLQTLQDGLVAITQPGTIVNRLLRTGHRQIHNETLQ